MAAREVEPRINAGLAEASLALRELEKGLPARLQDCKPGAKRDRCGVAVNHGEGAAARIVDGARTHHEGLGPIDEVSGVEVRGQARALQPPFDMFCGSAHLGQRAPRALSDDVRKAP